MNYSYDWYQYISRVQHYIEQQDRKIKELEQRITNLESKESSKNSTTIEKLEYHFDQLKIERLDGTLHIGLSPEDLSNVDDMSLNQMPMNNEQRQHPTANRPIIEQLDQYVTKEGPAIIDHLSRQYNFPINNSHQEMLLKDVRNQLPTRVAYYENHAKSNYNPEDPAFYNFIFEQVKKEITHSLGQYFENEQSKGEA